MTDFVLLAMAVVLTLLLWKAYSEPLCVRWERKLTAPEWVCVKWRD